jgi:hypothetical protein
VRATDPIERELRRRELAEDPSERAARRAHDRWITQRRLWAAIDREGIVEPGAQARFICRRLYPDVVEEQLDRLADAVRLNTAAGRPLVRPARAADTVGEDLERLMAEHGYRVRASDTGPVG